ncbi:MAG: UDP-N-acetylglucosamine--N-acetylmuramyl-(pentapeptide) pyrophosphoryl-undecaprenol N-acetylglucosamine transferase [Lentisphaerae bacterium]|nr:UDP-N-acetylglucosamine--N-acetylmuramyl-(pentapeptide) pyrophosphoryl-undecaprenol N-acetylglucosamine transferase [Lentisphaerota bacterium]
MNVVIACGGTGGHIFPGVAVGRALRARGHEVTLWLGGRQVESLSTATWDGAVVRIRAAGFPSGLSFRSIGVACRLVLSILSCWRRMRRERPDVVVAMGGYASVGPGIAAHWLRIPLVLHESNAVPGRAVLLLSRYAAVTALGFAAAADYFYGRRTAVTGFPLRRNLAGSAPLAGLDPKLFTLLVMGGSQGAHALNVMVSEAICSQAQQEPGLQVVHLSGAVDQAEIQARYDATGVSAKVHAFLVDMGGAYAVADLAICRAGAASCAELVLCGVPALLVPLPTAARDHQRANAVAMVVAGGADMIEQAELSIEMLIRYIAACRQDASQLEKKRAALAGMDCGAADALLCELIEEVVG